MVLWQVRVSACAAILCSVYRTPLIGPEGCNYHINNCMSFLTEGKRDLVEQSLLQARYEATVRVGQLFS